MVKIKIPEPKQLLTINPSENDLLRPGIFIENDFCMANLVKSIAKIIGVF